jgi:hypothetical protein
VDTLGLVLLVVVTEANVQDRDGARMLLSVLATEFRRWNHECKSSSNIFNPRLCEAAKTQLTGQKNRKTILKFMTRFFLISLMI